MHSALEVGFESAKITGRSLNSAIRASISSVNVVGVSETPIKTVGRRLSNASAKVSTDGCTLNVVVETADPLLIIVQQPESIGVAEVAQVDEGSWRECINPIRSRRLSGALSMSC